MQRDHSPDFFLKPGGLLLINHSTNIEEHLERGEGLVCTLGVLPKPDRQPWEYRLACFCKLCIRLKELKHTRGDQLCTTTLEVVENHQQRAFIVGSGIQGRRE